MINKYWNLDGLSYENSAELRNDLDYMPVEPEY